MNIALFPIVGIPLLAFCLFNSSPARAAYTGLIHIPLAETVGAGNYDIELEVDGPVSPASTQAYIMNTEFGFGNRFEAGVDVGLTADASPRAIFNAKYQFARQPAQQRSFAVGLFNLANRGEANPFIAVTQDFPWGNGSLGVVQSTDHLRGYGGLQLAVGSRMNLLAEYTSGTENLSGVGMTYQFTKRMGVLTGLQFPNAGGSTLFTLHIVFIGPFMTSSS